MTAFGKAKTAARLAVALTRKMPLLLRYYRFPRSAARLLEGFGRTPVPNGAYDDLVRYFATSWSVYRNDAGSGALYPGLPSWSGADCDELEGFSRTMPLFGAWCGSGRNPNVTSADGGSLSLPAEFERGLLAGTDPNAETYWGDMPGKSNQRIVEAADVALATWLFRDLVWKNLSPEERDRVVSWLSLVNGRPGLDNNWHLFFVLIDRILEKLGHPGRINGVRERFERIKEFHLGDGWFADGPQGPVDFYNAWGFHYVLAWIDRIDPDWDPHFIGSVQAAFLRTYKHLIGPGGLPILGRSVHYRLSAPAPLIAGAESHPDIVGPGEARRALDVVWHHFVVRGALERGLVTQGYYGTDPRVVDPYSGPASGLWSLRSLVMAFAYPPDHAFWRARPEPLPVEISDFALDLHGPAWRVTGVCETGVIAIEVLVNPPDACPALEPFGRLRTLRSFAFGDPPRPKNLEAKYGRRIYRSDAPFMVE